LDLALNRDKPSIGRVESSRKDRGDVEDDGWIASKNRRGVGDIELRLLQSPHVCRMGLATLERRLAGLPVVKHRAREVVLTAGSKTGGLLFLRSGTVEVVKDGVQVASVNVPGSVPLWP
jgi:hypothetical protein